MTVGKEIIEHATEQTKENKGAEKSEVKEAPVEEAAPAEEAPAEETKTVPMEE